LGTSPPNNFLNCGAIAPMQSAPRPMYAGVALLNVLFVHEYVSTSARHMHIPSENVNSACDVRYDVAMSSESR